MLFFKYIILYLIYLSNKYSINNSTVSIKNNPSFEFVLSLVVIFIKNKNILIGLFSICFVWFHSNFLESIEKFP